MLENPIYDNDVVFKQYASLEKEEYSFRNRTSDTLHVCGIVALNGA
jgi:hypothetical protein